MALILLGYRLDKDKTGVPMENYSLSTHRALEEQGHVVVPVGTGHDVRHLNDLDDIILKSADLFLDLDCGRDVKGEFSFYHNYDDTHKLPFPTAIRFIDTHGQPSLHKRLARCYDHIFFAVYARRDLFAKHPSAHWCPNASDDKWFHPDFSKAVNKPEFTAGFFGSKDGLSRGEILERVCTKRDLPFDIREVGRHNRQRWPGTAQAMANCQVLFNMGQKHDGPNQRVIESMLVGRPLITDRDNTDGMAHLFQEHEHYVGYKTETDLGLALEWILSEYDVARNMALKAYKEVRDKHLVKHRVQQILEVCL